jgi:hypothetical protein
MKFILLSEGTCHGAARWSGSGQKRMEKVLELFLFDSWKKNMGGSCVFG